jgi:protocatechuate 3,4-dioxygenase beta subunit
VLTSSVVLAQDPLPNVTGRVVTVEGRPIAGAQLGLHLTRTDSHRHWPDRKLAEATSNADGRFRIELPERSVLVDELFCLLVDHPDYGPDVVYTITPCRPASLAIEVTLRSAPPLTGFVTSEKSLPLEGVEVAVYRNVFGQAPQDYLVARTRTDEKGAYSFPHVYREARARLIARRKNGDEAQSWSLEGPLSGWQKPPRLMSSRVDRYWSHVNFGNNVITGRVLDAATKRPIPIFAIGATPPGQEGGVPPSVRELFGDDPSLEPGTFAYPIPYGRRTVGVYARGYSAQIITIQPTTKPELGDILLERGVSVSGRVLDPHGTPVAAARVHVQPPGWKLDPLAYRRETYGIPHAITDVQGRYRIDGVPAGSVNVVAGSVALAPAMMGPIEVGADPVTAPDLRLAPGGRIVGRVVNGNWLSIDHVGVPLNGDRFEIGGLPTGDYKLLLGMEGMCAIKPQTVHVVAGETTEVEVVR